MMDYKPTTDQISRAMKAKNGKDWFSKENKRFFGDRQYFLKWGGVSKRWYFCRSTYGFSDMFSGKKTLTYAVNYLNDDYTIGDLIASGIETRQELVKFLAEL